ncbi:phospholipase D-like domain-containing protein [Herbaspirillum sp. WGmk3]|uniref:phospholipase D-like domain-containing protein n=1 Tax=Herbaspirillum sp. WGmk3 TaxID=2919925 RepID=UPI002090E31D|nr:phospholipase D-like domain-containing protein [Herbaspirillum sp. WGmk3]MCO4855739.1 phospholipase D-like domain-containing protein [Herbaspirillum sp. WGmk3]
MSTTQQASTVPLSQAHPRSRGSAQWLLESAQDKDCPIHRCNRLQMLYCGEQAFARICDDIRRAKDSVEIICWGFDPAMELERGTGAWPRGETWGDLLRDVAAGRYNEGKPVQVRLLSWYGVIGSALAHNMPGYQRPSDYEQRQGPMRGEASVIRPDAGGMPDPVAVRDRREVFNASWYRAAEAGAIPNLNLRVRDGDMRAVWGSLEKEAGKRSFLETAGMVLVATDHQKSILIDYEYEGGAQAVGYVMGLNAVTDYWDTEAHLYHDPRRGEGWEGRTEDGRPGLKPYQDYACRIEGEALVSISKNFTDAWNRAKGKGGPLARTHDVHQPPPGLCAALKGERSVNAQIIRTQPEENDKSIQRLYRQASSFARHYLYVENQYFQYEPWVRQIKEDRRKFMEWWQRAGQSVDDLPNLHVMVVMPTPELPQMVPRTYDAVRSLGHGDSMPNQDKLVEEDKKGTLGQSAAAVGSKEDVARELDGLGIRTLVGTSWTYDHDWRGRAPLKEGVAPTMADRYREIYIHSKLMVIDDAMLTVGSANLNLRSMAVDAEMNVACDDPVLSAEVRRHVWGRHTGGMLDGGGGSPREIAVTFEEWIKLMKANAFKKNNGGLPIGFLFPFRDERVSRTRLA